MNKPTIKGGRRKPSSSGIPLLILSAVRCIGFASCSTTMMFCLTTGPDQQSQGLWTETSKTMSKGKFFLPLVMSGYFATVMKRRTILKPKHKINVHMLVLIKIKSMHN
jgi:hypothetical protein